jgi:hypothetical protein
MNYTRLIEKLRDITLGRRGESIDEAEYYHGFALVLHEFFEKKYKHNYLLSFPFVSEKGAQKNPSSDYLISEDLKMDSKRIRDYLVKGEKILEEVEGSFSLTKLMVENLISSKIQSILLKSKSENTASIEKNKVLREYLSEFIVIDLRKELKGDDGKYTDYFKEVASKLKVTSEEYKHLLNRLVQFAGIPAPDHYFYLIKPTANHKQFNVVLALALKNPIPADEFHLLRLLIYRFVSEVAIKKLEEVEELRRKKSYSLTTHALKTQINTTIRPKVGMIKKEVLSLALPDESQLNKHVIDLETRTNNLFCMASYVTLIDKVKDQVSFERSGINDELLVREEEKINIYEYCEYYNSNHKRLDEIVISDSLSNHLSIKTYDVYFSQLSLQNFLNTLFENLHKYGRRNKGKIELKVSKTSSAWIFENKQKESTFIDESKLTGNLLLFQVLIEDTGSGKLSIDPSGDKFKVKYEYAPQSNKHPLD